MEAREERGLAIANNQNQVKRIDDCSYLVASQSGKGDYEVIKGPIGWACSCPDYLNREIKCKHVWAVEFSLLLRREVEATRIEAIPDVTACLYCGSTNILKDGIRHNKRTNIQIYICRDCGRYFSHNLGFEGMHSSPQAITGAIQLFFTGESLRNVQKFLSLQGVNVSHVTIYKWIRKYVRKMETYLDQMKPKLGETWRADELYLKVKGNMKYLFALMDDETRYWIAQQVADKKGSADIRPLLQEAKRVAGGRNPKTFITDGAPNFQDACNHEFWKMKKATRTVHIHNVRWRDGPTNNKMERLNGEIRDREKVMRGVKREDSPILKGYEIFHNYVRPHMALDGKTPAEACGITVEGENKWLTLIQNASRPTTVNGLRHPTPS